MHIPALCSRIGNTTRPIQYVQVPQMGGDSNLVTTVVLEARSVAQVTLLI